MRTSAPRERASSSEPLLPGTRIMSPKVVKMTFGSSASEIGVVDAPDRDHADGAARPVHQLEPGRQQLVDPVLVDRVRVPAADLHDRQLAARRHRLGELARERPRQLARAELVDVLHAAPSAVFRISASSRS